jgi:hypothetical protein
MKMRLVEIKGNELPQSIGMLDLLKLEAEIRMCENLLGKRSRGKLL